jgi:hypothetical protein
MFVQENGVTKKFCADCEHNVRNRCQSANVIRGHNNSRLLTTARAVGVCQGVFKSVRHAGTDRE